MRKRLPKLNELQPCKIEVEEEGSKRFDCRRGPRG